MKKLLFSILCAFVLGLGLYISTEAASPFKIENGVLVSYNGSSDVASVTVPDNVTSIGHNAFYDCNWITSVTLPKGVTRIEMSAFRNCAVLSKINFPSGLTYIGAYAFCGCRSINNISLPGTLDTIMDKAFEGCTSLTHISLPGKISVIRWGTFHDCIKLKSADIPVSCAEIKEYAFYGCVSFTDIYYGGTSSQWNNIEGIDGVGRGLAGINPRIHYSSKKVKVKGISLNKSQATVNKAKTITLKATLKPTNATNKGVTWSSSNKKIATVSSGGRVKGIKKGTVTITAKTKDGGYKATCKVKVVGPKVTGVKLNKSSVNVTKGKTYQLTETVSPSDAHNKKVTWKSNNKSVATVSATGKITAKKAGRATITVTTEDGKKKATCRVTVKNPVKVKSISLSKKASVKAGESIKLEATVSPDNATNKKVKWESSDTDVAKVNSKGKVTGVSKGNAVITVTAADGSKVSAVCKITVNE